MPGHFVKILVVVLCATTVAVADTFYKSRPRMAEVMAAPSSAFLRRLAPDRPIKALV